MKKGTCFFVLLLLSFPLRMFSPFLFHLHVVHPGSSICCLIFRLWICQFLLAFSYRDIWICIGQQFSSFISRWRIKFTEFHSSIFPTFFYVSDFTSVFCRTWKFCWVDSYNFFFCSIFCVLLYFLDLYTIFVDAYLLLIFLVLACFCIMCVDVLCILWRLVWMLLLLLNHLPLNYVSAELIRYTFRVLKKDACILLHSKKRKDLYVFNLFSFSLFFFLSFTLFAFVAISLISLRCVWSKLFGETWLFIFFRLFLVIIFLYFPFMFSWRSISSTSPFSRIFSVSYSLFLPSSTLKFCS